MCYDEDGPMLLISGFLRIQCSQDYQLFCFELMWLYFWLNFFAFHAAENSMAWSGLLFQENLCSMYLIRRNYLFVLISLLEHPNN